MAQVLLKTNKGDITLTLDAAKAPKTVANFLAYVKSGHYDGTIFHRVIDNFMIQGGGMAPGMKQKPTQAEIENFRRALLANPAGYIAQPTLSLSTCPTYVDSGIAPRHIDLRPFVLSGKEVQMVPGGLTRVALKDGSLVVNSSQGGGTKDTWILEAAPAI